MNILKRKEFKAWRKSKIKGPYFKPKTLKLKRLPRTGQPFFKRLPLTTIEHFPSSTPLTNAKLLGRPFNPVKNLYNSPTPLPKMYLLINPKHDSIARKSPSGGNVKPLLESYNFLPRKSNFFKIINDAPKGLGKFLKKSIQNNTLTLEKKNLIFIESTRNFKLRAKYIRSTLSPDRSYKVGSNLSLNRFFRNQPGVKRSNSTSKLVSELYNSWASNRTENGKFHLKTALRNRITLSRRKFYPYVVKPWLFDLVLNTKLNDKNDKGGHIRKKFHEKALSSVASVSKKKFVTLSEDLLKFNLEAFHSRLSRDHTFINLYVDRLYASGFENFISEQPIEPYLNFTRYYSYGLHEFTNFKYSSFFLKSFLPKKTHIGSIKSLLTNKTLNKLSNYSFINYPRFKKKPYIKLNYSLPEGISEPLKEKNQLKNVILKSSDKTQTKRLFTDNVSLNFLLNSLEPQSIILSNYRNFFKRNVSYFKLRSLELFLGILCGGSTEQFFKLSYSILPKQVNRSNSKVSYNYNFYNFNRTLLRGKEVPKIFFEGKKSKNPYLIYTSYRRGGLNSFNSFCDNYSKYLTLRSNIRQNSIRRPLYSLFLISSNVTKTHSFRLALTKKTSSLMKYPVCNLKTKWRSVYHNLFSLTFFSQRQYKILEVNADSIVTKFNSDIYKGSLGFDNFTLFWRSTRSSQPQDSNLFLTGFDNLSNVSSNLLKVYEKPNKVSKVSQVLSINSLSSFTSIFSYPSLYKFFFWNYKNIIDFSNTSNELKWVRTPREFSTKLFLGENINRVITTNLVPMSFFRSSYKKRIIKTLSNDIYLPRSSIYFYKTLITFIEHHTSKKVFLKLNPFLEGSLSFKDACRCSIWYSKVNVFQKILGHRIFVHESLRIFMSAVRFRDPDFLANWIRSMLYRMSFWKYRVLFRYIKYVFRALLAPYFNELDFKGIRLVVRGKISVAGNARARTLAFSVGNTSHSEMNNRVLSSFNTIESFTGVMGFRLSFYF